MIVCTVLSKLPTETLRERVTSLLEPVFVRLDDPPITATAYVLIFFRDGGVLGKGISAVFHDDAPPVNVVVYLALRQAAAGHPDLTVRVIQLNDEPRIRDLGTYAEERRTIAAYASSRITRHIADEDMAKADHWARELGLLARQPSPIAG